MEADDQLGSRGAQKLCPKVIYLQCGLITDMVGRGFLLSKNLVPTFFFLSMDIAPVICG